MAHDEPGGGHSTPVLAEHAGGGDCDLTAIVHGDRATVVRGAGADGLDAHARVHLGHHRHEHHPDDEGVDDADEQSDPPAVVVEGGEQGSIDDPEEHRAHDQEVQHPADGGGGLAVTGHHRTEDKGHGRHVGHPGSCRHLHHRGHHERGDEAACECCEEIELNHAAGTRSS